MKAYQFYTGRIYDFDQRLSVLVRDDKDYDDRFLRNDIVFSDASRGIKGVIKFSDRDDKLNCLDCCDMGIDVVKHYIMSKYDNGEYTIADEIASDQLAYYFARCDVIKED